MKGVILAAGYGTRFLPVTKTIPKEMLPLIDKPAISFIIEEFLKSNIKDIIIISSRRKKVLEDYMDTEIELDQMFHREKAEEKLKKIKPYDANFCFVHQKEMLGTGHALLQIKNLLNNEPVVVAYPDDLHFGDTPLTEQLIRTYKKTDCSVLATIHNPPNINRYGVLALDDDNLHVKGIVEKPAPGKEPGKEVSIGRYLYTPDFFNYLEEGWKKHLEKQTQGEYFHIYALEKQIEQKKVVYKTCDGERLDIGSPSGYLRAILKYASNFPEYRKTIEEFTGGELPVKNDK